MTAYDSEIGRIKSTHLGDEDHGIFSVNVEFEFGPRGMGSIQGTGHRGTDSPTKSTHFRYGEDRIGTAWGMEFIRRFVQTVGSGSWENLPGATVFVLRDKGDSFGPIKGIRQLPVDGSEEFIFDDIQFVYEQDRNKKERK